jgi:hypothetical protein
MTDPAWQHMLYIAVDTVRVRTVLAFREAQPDENQYWSEGSNKGKKKKKKKKKHETYRLGQSD